MGLVTKFFGIKIDAQKVKNLVNILNIKDNIDGGNTRIRKGKLKIVPNREGLGIDLYIFTEDFTTLYGLSGDNSKRAEEKVLTSNRKYFHYFRTIPYNQINQLS